MSAEIIPFESYDTKASAALAPIVHLVHITNALMPMSGKQERNLSWEEAKPVRAYLADCFPHGFEDFTISLNGRILAPEDLARVTPRGGDFIVVTPKVQGGNAWRTIAQIGVMAAAITASIFLGPEFVALGWASSAAMGTAMASVAAGLISIGGNMLINTFMGASPSNKAQQPSWAFGGPQTLAQPGVVIPKGYGTFQSGGNVIASFVDIEGSNQYINALVCYGFGPARAISNIQINGKDISTYQDVQYYTRLGTNNQTAIPAFNRIVNGYPQETQVTYSGGPVVVPGTGDLTQALQVDVQFPMGVYYVSGAGNNLPCKIVYKVEYSVSGSGVWNSILSPNSTQNIVVYNGDGTINWGSTPKWVLLWTGAPGGGIVLKGDNGTHNPGDGGSVTQTITKYAADGSSSTSSQTFQGEWQMIDPTINQVEVLSWWDGWVQYVNDTTETVYNRTSIYGLAPNKYDVRVTKYGSNNADNTVGPGDYDSPRRGQEVWLHSVNEITYQDLSYPNMILVGVRALATNQLSGANINITALIQYGLRTLDNNILPAALQEFEEDNPACVAADMMLDPLYGGGSYPGILPTNIERFIDEWTAWAAYNDTLVPDGNGNSIRLHVFNGVFDNEDNLWNQVQTVGRMSRACVVSMGRDYGVFVNQVDTPVQMFSVGNIKQDSFEETWLALDDRANQVEVEFADSTRNYKTDNPLVYMSPDDQAAGTVVKNTRIRGTGITIPAQAWHLGHFMGLSNDLLLRTGKFECDVDAIACRPGQLVILQHDVPQWGWGGRTLPNSTVSILNLDRNDLPWDGVTAYNVIVLHSSLLRYTTAVSSVATSTDSTGLVIGTICNLVSFDNTKRVTRAVINGTDCAILSSAVNQITVTIPPGFTPTGGVAALLYDTDVMETATVANVTPGPNNTQIATLGTPLSHAPADFSTYFYGQPGAQKIVRLTNITRKGEFRAAVEWIDYDPNCYTVGTPVIGETSAIDAMNTKPGVTDLTAAEVFQIQQSGSYGDFATLAWKNGQNTEGVAIYGSYPGLASPKLLARLTGRPTSWKYQIAPTVSWTFTVVGFDAHNNYAPFSTAPTVTLVGAGVTKNLVLGSTFQSGFAYWNINVRVDSYFPDSLTTDSTDGGRAIYTVNPLWSALTAPNYFLTQLINPKLWSVGQTLILSAYFEVTSGGLGALLAAKIRFTDGSGTTLGQVDGTVNGYDSLVPLTRVATVPTVIPTGTVNVWVEMWYENPPGGTVSIPANTAFEVSHVLLEIAQPGQTTPSVWADLDVNGNVIDTFQLGSSATGRTQGSTVPTYAGVINYDATPSQVTLSWSGLIIAWPDGGITQIQDGSEVVTGLAASTEYYAYLYWDVINGGVQAVTPASAVGTPAILSTSFDVSAAAACTLDGRVQLARGVTFTTPATGGADNTGSWGNTGLVFIHRPTGGPKLPIGPRY